MLAKKMRSGKEPPDRNRAPGKLSYESLGDGDSDPSLLFLRGQSACVVQIATKPSNTRNFDGVGFARMFPQASAVEGAFHREAESKNARRLEVCFGILQWAVARRGLSCR
jgi:hypothetical protein